MCIVCSSVGVPFPLPSTKQPIEEHYHSLIHLRESICHTKPYLATWQQTFSFWTNQLLLEALTQISELQTRIECWWCLVSGTEPHIPCFLASIVRRNLTQPDQHRLDNQAQKSLPVCPHTHTPAIMYLYICTYSDEISTDVKPIISYRITSYHPNTSVNWNKYI